LFIDEISIYIQAGKGGDGVISFRKEKFVDRGGPDGGHGGKGGDVYLIAREGISSLTDFRYQKHFKANPGGKGEGNHRHGANGEDLYISVPLGTLIYEIQDQVPSSEQEIVHQTYRFIADLSSPGQTALVAKGGMGGKGNASFSNSLEQAPRIAESGASGEQKKLFLELKIIADIGLVGFPNAGKSTLLAQTTNAKPKIADYPFTTLVPNIGVVEVSPGKRFTVADIPGLLEGAHEGKGLGFTFLRHIERCRVLLYIIDIQHEEEKTLSSEIQTLFNEVKAFNDDLFQRPSVIVCNKRDAVNESFIERIPDMIRPLAMPYFIISGKEKIGLTPLLEYLYQQLQKLPMIPVEPSYIEYYSLPETAFSVDKIDTNTYRLTCEKIERIVEATDLSYPGSIRYIHRMFKRMHVDKILASHGVMAGDIVLIGEKRFQWV
jgi:GTP-binding protein